MKYVEGCPTLLSPLTDVHSPAFGSSVSKQGQGYQLFSWQQSNSFMALNLKHVEGSPT